MSNAKKLIHWPRRSKKILKKKSTEFYIRNGGFYTLHEKTIEIVETKRSQKDFRDYYNELWC